MAKEINIRTGGGNITITGDDGRSVNVTTQGAPTSFASLTDVPNTYVSQSGKIIRVKSSEDGLEFIDPEVIEYINWGEITGTLSNQTDLQDALDLKYDSADFNTDFDTRFSSKTTTDLIEGTNLYYTQDRFDTAFSNKTTTDLIEGTNLYYTQDRFDTAFSNKTTTDLIEGDNLYYTDERAQDSVGTILSNEFTYDDTTPGISLNYTNISHTDLQDIGTNTHAEIDTHIADGTIHYAQSAISIPASQISDFDTEVSNNTDVSANTSARHDAVTVTDSSEIDFTLTGQDITASLINGSIDESKLDTSVNASLDLADSAVQDVVTSLGYTPEDSANKGQSNGYASLDSGGKIPASELPSTVMDFKGNWDADTNTPTLADGTGNAGDVYLVSVAGTQDLGSGDITFALGDWVLYNGTVWQKSINSNDVVSVNGQQGVVVLDADDIDDTSTAHKFVTATDLTNLSNLSGTNTGDQDLSGLVPYTGATSNVDLGSNDLETTGDIIANSFITDSGVSSDFVKGDGSLDSSPYITGVGWDEISGTQTDISLSGFNDDLSYEVPLTFSTGLTRITNTITINTTQNITNLSNLTSNGFVVTSGGDGTLGIDTTTYLDTTTAGTTYVPYTGATSDVDLGSYDLETTGSVQAEHLKTTPNTSKLPMI